MGKGIIATEYVFRPKIGPELEGSPWVSAYSTCNSYRCRFESQLFQFRFSFLLMPLGKQQRMTHILGPLHPRGDLKEAPGFWLQTSLPAAIVAIWE